jgi:hypothetical protein
MQGVKIDHLLMLIGFLFVVYFFYSMKETFEQQFKTKQESDKAISEAYHKYIWGTPHPAR